MTKSAQKTYTITVSGMTGAKLFEEDTIMKNNSSIKTVVAVGIGAALFFVLGRFVAIPSPVPNTNISLQYAVLALLAAMYGPVAGGLIGFIGHALIDLSWGGSPVELGNHFRIRWCGYRPVCQETERSGRRIR